jgi:hypothetical protein
VTRKHKTSADPIRRDLPAYANPLAAKYVQFLRPIGAAVFPPRVMLFIAFFAWYLYAVVDLRLVFQARDMLFLWNFRYFTDFLGQPGSLLEWTDKLLVQWCYWGWPGAMAIAAAAWLLLVSTVGLMNVLGRARTSGTWVIPAILLVLLYGRYLFPSQTLVGLALAMTAANLWCRMPAWRTWPRLVLFIAISAVLYYLVGEAYYCFAACAAIHEALARKRRISGVLFLSAAGAVKFGLDVLLDRLNPATHNFYVFSLAMQERAPLDWREVVLYFYFPACALLAVYRQPFDTLAKAWWRRIWKSITRQRPQKPEESRNQDSRNAAGAHRGLGKAAIVSGIRWTVGTVLLLSLPVAAGFYSLDRANKLIQEINYDAGHQRWEELLTEVKRLPPEAYSKYVNHDVNLALYHTGRLPYQMFSYPQHYRCPALMIPEQIAPDMDLLYKPFGFLLELGRVSEAERVAVEMLETRPTGATLKRLALTLMIKGQSADAHVVLNVLRDDLVWSRWAERYLQRLAADPDLTDDVKIRQMREWMLEDDDLHLTSSFGPRGILVNPEVMLHDLLKRNGTNRMAFEYLMAIHLCNCNVRGVAELFPLLDKLSYPVTPSLYEQALLIYLSRHLEEATQVGSDVFFHDRKITGPSREKAHRLNAILARYGGINEKAEAAVARELGNTYFYYFFFTSRKR